MSDYRRYYFFGGAVAFLMICFLAWNYINAIQDRNHIERDRIYSDEIYRKAQLDQAQKEIEMKIEADIEAAEINRKADEEKATTDAYNQRLETYRKECKTIFDDNVEDYEDFLNSCTRNNTIDFCTNSGAGQLFAKNVSKNFVQNCTDSKMKTGW